MKEILNVKAKKLYLGDRPFFLLSGDMHYFRIHPSQWAERLKLMAEFGLTAVQTYCPWNMHEPSPENFNFSGLLDLGAYLDAAEAVGLKVMLRPSNYICAEWEFGGLPSWLLKDPSIILRSHDPQFIEACDRYYSEICKIIVPRLSTNGGPVIAVALENEFGGFGCDPKYMTALHDIMRKYGIDVPLYTTDGDNGTMLHYGTTDDVILRGLNFRSTPGLAAKAKALHEKLNPDMPYFISELWAGRAIYWGEPFYYRDTNETAESFKEALELGAHINFYMFGGGTNFGSMSGAIKGRSYTPRPNTPSRYIAHTTSYDEDAFISEYGVPTEKYYVCRAILDDFLGKDIRTHRYEYKAQKISNIRLTEAAYLFDNLDVLTEKTAQSILPLKMEDLDQAYGLMLYTKQLETPGDDSPHALTLSGVHDRATIYVDGKYLGTHLRDRENTAPAFAVTEGGARLDILVENIARMNTGKDAPRDRKGILKDVVYCAARLVDFENRTIPLSNIKDIKYNPITHEIADDLPVFLKGTFNATAGVDTFVHTKGFTRGHIWINGFDLGRYWDIGPQMTLYVPGALLKEKNNVIEILDINPKNNPTLINCIDKHLLEME